MAISLKTLGSCEAVAPVFGATAVVTVTAVKLPWEGRDKRRRDENNDLSCSLHACIMVGGQTGYVFVCLL